MNGDLIAAAVLATPAALFAAITFTGHARARHTDDTLATALAATTVPGQPGGPGEAQPATESAPFNEHLATVTVLPQYRRNSSNSLGEKAA